MIPPLRSVLRLALTAATAVVAAGWPPNAPAANVTECSTGGLCYCVNADFKDAIAEKVDYFRKTMAAERAKGKAIGYMSVPLSSTVKIVPEREFSGVPGPYTGSRNRPAPPLAVPFGSNWVPLQMSLYCTRVRLGVWLESRLGASALSQ